MSANARIGSKTYATNRMVPKIRKCQNFQGSKVTGPDFNEKRRLCITGFHLLENTAYCGTSSCLRQHKCAVATRSNSTYVPQRNKQIDKRMYTPALRLSLQGGTGGCIIFLWILQAWPFKLRDTELSSSDNGAGGIVQGLQHGDNIVRTCD